MKRICHVLLFLLPAAVATAQNADSIWFVNNYIKREYSIPMRDGVHLFTSLYIPKDSLEKHPILLTRTPFSCSPYGETQFAGLWNTYIKAYLKENYILVTQDVRGKFMSEGTFVNVRPFIKEKRSVNDIDESTDAFDTIDWLIRNIPGNNGRVGVTGISYNGFYASQAAVSNHPALVAVSPQAPVTDWFMGDDFHRNGAFALIDAFGFFTRGFGSPRRALTSEWPQAAFSHSAPDSYRFHLQTGALPNFTKLTGDSISFWNDMMKHPNYDDWWKARDARRSLYNIKAAVLVVGGFYDAEDCFGPLNTYKAIEKQNPSADNRLVMGPWYHGQWARNDGTALGNLRFGSNTSEWFVNNIEIPFFNFHLKNKGSLEKLDEAVVFFTGENQWKQFSQWPPMQATNKALYLNEENKLSWRRPSAKSSYSSYLSDPAKPVPYIEGTHDRRIREYMTGDQRFAASRTDVLVFQTEALEEDITLAGPLIADLSVSLSTTDADFVVKLIDVFPDDFKYGAKDPYPMGGYQLLVRGDVMRGRFRNSFEKPEPFTPSRIAKVKYTMPDIAHRFQKGHRIMVQIQSSWFPLIDRNPQEFTDIYHARDDQFKKSTIRIYHDQVHSSNIILPVLP